MNIKASIEIARPVNSIMGCLTIIIGYLNTRFEPQAMDFSYYMVLACLAYFFLGSSGNIINDIYDSRIDKVNRPGRPIPRGDISAGQAWWLYILSLGLGITLAINHGLIENILIINVILAVFFGFIGWFYAAYAKKSGFPGNIIVSLSYSIGLLYGAILNVYPVPCYMYLIFFASFFLLLSREVIKGCEDIEGDAQEGARTLAVIIGVKKAALVSVCFNCIAFVFFVLLLFAPIINPRAFFIMMILCSAVIAYASGLSLLGDLDRKKLRKISLLLKAGKFLGILAFIAASVN